MFGLGGEYFSVEKEHKNNGGKIAYSGIMVGETCGANLLYIFG